MAVPNHFLPVDHKRRGNGLGWRFRGAQIPAWLPLIFLAALFGRFVGHLVKLLCRMTTFETQRCSGGSQWMRVDVLQHQFADTIGHLVGYEMATARQHLEAIGRGDEIGVGR